MIRNSQNKNIVIKIIKKSNRPLTANEIFEISKKDININLSTVYRILNNLENNGNIIKTIRQNKTAYYELNTKVHKHQITCKYCNSEVQIDICPIIEDFTKNIENTTGYEITYHNLELRGICNKCKNKYNK